MSTTERQTLARKLVTFMREEIPLADNMELHLASSDEQHLAIAAPLPPNVNDKGCAFGGSLVSLLTLAGWGLLVLRLRGDGRACDVYVQDSQVHYLAPVWGDLVAEARLGSGESWSSFDAALAARGRARIAVRCRVPAADGADACTLDARFVAIAR